MPSSHSKGLNCFGLLRRDNTLISHITTKSVTSAVIIEQLDKLSLDIDKETYVVLDNARVHTSKAMQECRAIWEKRGLYIFYLPPYSPHLNIIETLWRKLKHEWLQPQDYFSFDDVAYATKQILNVVGKSLKINFSDFRMA